MTQSIITLAYQPDFPADTVINDNPGYEIQNSGPEGDAPITESVTDASFVVTDATGSRVIELGLGTGLTWDDATKVLRLSVRNDELADLASDTIGQYRCSVLYDTGRAQVVAEGKAVLRKGL